MATILAKGYWTFMVRQTVAATNPLEFITVTAMELPDSVGMPSSPISVRTRLASSMALSRLRNS